MEMKDMRTKIRRWAFMQFDLDYTIENNHSTSMSHVEFDALSRNPVCIMTQDRITLQFIQHQ